MGMLIKQDQHVGTLLDMLNVRFAPQVDIDMGLDGVAELADIQQRFKVFAEGRPLKDSAAIMNLGGFTNGGLKNNWYNYLDSLAGLSSDQPDKNGDQRIVSALIENLESANPEPVYFTVHDFDADKRVTITKGSPLVYMSQEYIVISLPMRAQRR
jgi:hypothetical protein